MLKYINKCRYSIDEKLNIKFISRSEHKLFDYDSNESKAQKMFRGRMKEEKEKFVGKR
jgi:hypothetical protein